MNPNGATKLTACYRTQPRNDKSPIVCDHPLNLELKPETQEQVLGQQKIRSQNGAKELKPKDNFLPSRDVNNANIVDDIA